MDNFPLSQELDHIIHIRVIRKSQNIIVCHTRFLFCCKVFCQIGNWIALYTDRSSIPRESRGRCGIYTGRMIHKIRSKRRVLNLAVFQIPCKLVYNCTDDFQVPQFFCTDRSIRKVPLSGAQLLLHRKHTKKTATQSDLKNKYS